MTHKLPFLAGVLLLAAGWAGAASKSESFDRDPGWEAVNNRMKPKRIRNVTQDFGYSPTHFAGGESGELGGLVWRSATPAYYAARIPARTLNDPLDASGTFVITDPNASAGLFFGWFNARQRGGGRPDNSLGLDIDCEHSGGRLSVRMISAGNKSCGTFITPFVPGKYRPTPLAPGVHYRWHLNYNPNTNFGRFEFTIRGDGAKPWDFEGKTFTVDLPEVIRKEGTTMDRFGLVNGGRSGAGMRIYFDNLEYDGAREDFSRDPGWDGVGNRVTMPEAAPPGIDNFGFTNSNFAGGNPGEIGGIAWRTDRYFGWYADRLPPLGLTNHLTVTGRVVLMIGAPDSGVCFGWFDSHAGNHDATRSNFLGVTITGPTRIGHYFSPASVTSQGRMDRLKRASIIVPGKIYDFKIEYDPSANGGDGTVRATLGHESATLDLKRGHRNEGAVFDRFGICSDGPGGGMVKIYFDDLTYTAGP